MKRKKPIAALAQLDQLEAGILDRHPHAMRLGAATVQHVLRGPRKRLRRLVILAGLRAIRREMERELRKAKP